MEQNNIARKPNDFGAYNSDDCDFVVSEQQQQQQQQQQIIVHQQEEDSIMRGSTPGGYDESPDAGVPSGTTSETSVSFESAASSTNNGKSGGAHPSTSSSSCVRRCCKAERKNSTNSNAKVSKRKQKKISSTLLFPTTRSMPAYYQYLLLHSIQIDEDVEIILPKDPRRWSKEDINLWLMELSLEHNINPPIDSSRFPFNGKALCTLKVEMFVSRVPDFGKLLYKDVQLRLAKALITEKVDSK